MINRKCRVLVGSDAMIAALAHIATLYSPWSALQPYSSSRAWSAM